MIYRLILLIKSIWNIIPIILIPTVISLNKKNKKLNDFILNLYTHQKISQYEYTTKTCTTYSNNQNNQQVNENNPPQPPQNNNNQAENSNYTQFYNNKADISENHADINNNISKPIQTINQIQPEQKKKVNSASFLFIIGTIFIILASAAFSAATWVSLSSIQRCIILFSASIFLFFVSFAMKKFFSLTNTSISFYISALVCVSITYLTSGYYHLMGNWLSYDGKGFYLLIGLAFLIIAIITQLGRYLYQKRFLSYFSSFESGIFIIFLCLQAGDAFKDSFAFFSLFIAIAQAVLVFLTLIFHPFDRLKSNKIFNITGKSLAVLYTACTLPYIIANFFMKVDFIVYIIIAMYFFETLYLALSKKNFIFKILNTLSLIDLFIILCHNIKILLSGSIIFYHEAETAESLFIFTALCCIASIIYKYYEPLRNVFSNIIFYFLTGFGAILCVSCSDIYPISVIAPLFFAVIILMFFIDKNKIFSTVSAVILPLPLLMIFSETLSILGKNATNDLIYLIFDILFAAISVSCIYLSTKTQKFSVLQYSFGIITSIILINSAFSLEKFTAVLFILTLAAFFATFKSNINIYSILNIIAVIAAYFNWLESIFIDKNDYSIALIISSTALSVIFIILSRLFYNESFLIKNKQKKLNIDMFQVAAVILWIAVFEFNSYYFEFKYDAIISFIKPIILSLVVANLIRKKTPDKIRCTILTVSSFLITLSLINRPFLVFNKHIVDHKIDLCIIALFGFAVRYIFKNYKKTAKILSTIIHVFAYAGLMFDALFYEGIINMLLVLVITFIILITSFLTKSKRWFFISGISLLLFTIYSSKDFLSQIKWWVYLFVVGILLIFTAAINEYYKNKDRDGQKNILQKFARIFDGWEW